MLWGLIVGVTGCGDYPSEGELNTDELRRRAEVVDVSGWVYGITPDTLDAAERYVADTSALGSIRPAILSAQFSKQDFPELKLSYGGISAAPLSGLTVSLQKMAIEKEKEIKQKIAADIRQWSEKADATKGKMHELKVAGEKYNAAIAGAQSSLESAQKDYDAKVKAYNVAYAAPVKKLSELAVENGLDPIADYQNPFKNYGYSERPKGTADQGCGTDRIKIVVDARAELKKCFYFSLPNHLSRSVVAEKSKPILKATIPAFVEASEALGEKPSWNSKGSGAQFALRQAKENFSSAQRKAANDFGTTSRRKYRRESLQRDLDNIQSQIDSFSSPEYLDRQFSSSYINFTEQHGRAVKAYIAAMEADLLSKLDKVSELRFADEKATFDGVSGGYEAVMVLGEAIVGNGRGRDAAVFLNYENLTTEAAAEAEIIESVIGEESFKHTRGLADKREK